MRSRWAAISADVEWHAGHRGFERPVAMRVSGTRVELTVESSSCVGHPVAGRPAQRVFIVRDSDGRRLRIQVSADGRTKVEVETSG